MSGLKDPWNRGYFAQQVQLWGYWGAVLDVAVLTAALLLPVAYVVFVLMFFDAALKVLSQR